MVFDVSVFKFALVDELEGLVCWDLGLNGNDKEDGKEGEE